MPIQFTSAKGYKQNKIAQVKWDSFRGGLNTFLRDTEIDKDEMAKSKDLMLIGRGIPTKRWGSDDYFMSGATGITRGLRGYSNTAGGNELLAITDEGYLVKKSGASYSIITGASWASGYYMEMTQLDDNMYLANGDNNLAKYNGSSLAEFTGVSVPTGLSATNLSGVSGTFSYSWRVSAENAVGETIASDSIILGNLPQNVADTLIRLTWTTASPSSLVRGYVIYGRESGTESFLARVQPNSLRYDDNGTDEPSVTSLPVIADTTTGPIAKYVIKHHNRLVVAGIKDQPSRVMISGSADSDAHEKFHWSQQGGFIDVDKDSGDNITGLRTFGNKIIVFKQRSVWSIGLETAQIGNYDVLDPQLNLITGSNGCMSHRSTAAVENDIMYLSRDGVYVLGYEPNILNVIRANEISVNVRDFFDSVSVSDMEKASAVYKSGMYILSLPSSKKTIIFDRERRAWVGPWNTPYEIHQWHKYYDAGNAEHLLTATEDTFATKFDESYKTDRGNAFTTEFKSRREDWDDWSTFKNIWDLLSEWRNISGSVNMNIVIEGLEGQTNTVPVSGIEGETTGTAASWGPVPWGNAQWGDSEESGSALDVTDIPKRVILNKTGRTVQVEISTNGASDDYELLGIRINAKPSSRGTVPYSWNI